jgi:S-DNA-T family DNA segregation ATPase FtsK/SpoIIIE
MSMSFGPSSDYFSPFGALRHVFRRYGLAGTGAAVLIAAAALIASLMTWRVDDPSLSFATDAPVRNILGMPGAIVADLVMQFLGLASIALVLTAVTIGWSLLRLRPLRHPLGQVAAAFVGILMASFALACLPVFGRWPLPVGLGGVTGDILLSIPEAVAGGPLSAGIRVALTIIAGGTALGLLVSACAVTSGSRQEPGFERDRAVWDEGIAGERPGDGFDDDSHLPVLAGIFTHWYLALRNLPARLFTRSFWRRNLHHSADDWPPAANGRQEPVFFDGMDTDPTPNNFRPVGIAGPDSRVSAPAGRPKPGKRARRESQPSLLETQGYELPPLHLLSEPKARARGSALNPAALEQNARILEGVLEDFGVRGEIINVRPGPVVTLYELEPAPGIKSSRVVGLADDIARSMSAITARVAVIPGRNVIGIELPNAGRETVYLREMLASTDFEKSRAKLAVALGKTIGGEPVVVDLAKMPHLLVAGTTGSGKSVSINTMILSLVYRLTPEQCRLIMIDPKMLELSVYDGIPHLLTPVVTDPKKAVVALKWTVREMEDRYKQMSKLGVRNIDGFNQRVAAAKKKGEVITRTVQTGFDHDTGEAIFETEELDLHPMPFIVVIIDEMADLMMVAGKDIEGTVQRLAQMARAAGIHVVMATQRPSVDVITGTIKANFPTRVSFQVTSKIDSRTILGEQGAEQLLGQGDMLYMAGGGRIQRVHGPFVADAEVEDIVAHLKEQGTPEYLESITDESDEPGAGFDPLAGGSDESNDLYDRAVAIVLHDRKVSTSYIQRRLSIGYNRAASIIERMEQEGVIGPANHAGKREILVDENGGVAA